MAESVSARRTAIEEALHLERRLDQARISQLSAVIREHGIPLPGDDPALGASGAEHLAACRRVVASAYVLLEAMDEFEQALAELRRLVGSGMELLGEPWRS